MLWLCLDLKVGSDALFTVLPQCCILKKGKRKVQGVPQSQTAALPRHQEEEETNESKQAQIEQMYEKHTEMILPPVILYWKWCDYYELFFLMLRAKLLWILESLR